MTRLTLFVVLSFMFSCKKKTETDTPDATIANTMSIAINGKNYSAPITFQGFATTGNTVLELKGASSDIEINIQARSSSDHDGAGNYFFYCCQNWVLEKFAGGTLYQGISNGTVNNYASQKGRLTVTNADSQGYSGTFTLEGKNMLGQMKSFAGSFKVVY